MPSQAFVEGLADAAADNLIDLEDLRQRCLAAILLSDGSVDVVTATSGNGKSTTLQCNLPPNELLAAVNQALRIRSGTNVGISYADFSGLR